MITDLADVTSNGRLNRIDLFKRFCDVIDIGRTINIKFFFGIGIYTFTLERQLALLFSDYYKTILVQYLWGIWKSEGE